MTLPFVSCLCPTYRRPALLANAIACFENQDYPADRCELVILDDAGQFPTDRIGDNVRLISIPQRFESLPAKYNALARFARGNSDAYLICEDDDVYLPWHISAHVAALMPDLSDVDGGEFFHDNRELIEQRAKAAPRWSKPSRVLSTYTGQPEQEPAAGRFFASICVKAGLWHEVGGIPNTKRADFDQQFLALLQATGGPPGDPLDFSPGRVPGYCFRWGSTAAYHGQGAMTSPDDETWWDRCEGQGDATPVDRLVPAMDAEARGIYGRFAPTYRDFR